MTGDGSCLFGVCTAATAESRYTVFLEALRKEARNYRTKLLQFSCFCDFSERNENDQGEKAIFRLVPFEQLDALILLTESFKDDRIPKELAEKAISLNIPVFSVESRLEGCINLSYGYADAFGELIEHLITVHGCRTINLIAGIKGNPFEEERTRQYRECLTRHGIPIEEERIGYGDFWAWPTYTAVDHFMRTNLPFPDAIACENDAMAIACCDRLLEYGYSVPEDCLVVGLDGIDEAENRTPSITTAHKDIPGSVKMLFRLFQEFKNGGPSSGDIQIPFRVTHEQSCGCVPVASADNGRTMTRLLQDWASLTEFDRKMELMRHRIIRLSYRDMLSSLPSYTLDNTWICLRSDYNTAPEAIPWGTYEEPGEYYTRMMNNVLWTDGRISLYNRFFPLQQLLPDISDIMNQNAGLVFLPLHFQEATFGYIAFSMDSYWFKYELMQRFISNLCTVLQVIEQQERVVLLNRQLEASNQKLTELYSMDPLTGLYNRRGFHEFMEKLSVSREHPDDHLILLSIDMDGLKQINDTYGHKEGDYSLCLLSDCMKHLCRRFENLAAARFGGDEFIVAGFFPPESHIRKELINVFENQLSFLNIGSGKEYEVRASVGFVEVPLALGESLESAINEADRLMYEQKTKRKAERAAAAGASRPL